MTAVAVPLDGHFCVTRVAMGTGQTLTTRRMRTIGAFMAGVSLIAIIAIGLPWADEYQRLRRETAEFDGPQVRLIEARHRQKQMDQIEKKISEHLDAAIYGSTTPRNTQAVREQLIDFVRESGGAFAAPRNWNWSNTQVGGER